MCEAQFDSLDQSHDGKLTVADVDLSTGASFKMVKRAGNSSALDSSRGSTQGVSNGAMGTGAQPTKRNVHASDRLV